MPPSPPVSTGPHRLRHLATRRSRLGVAAVALASLLAVVAGGCGLAGERGASASEPGGVWHPALSTPTSEPTPEPEPEPPVVSVSATGDIIMGDVGRLPPNAGSGFFDQVAGALTADLVMGNLEQPLTDDTGFRKCPEDAEACHAFRAPPRYAGHLSDAGFHLMNLANNHGWDFGPDGHENTKAALEQHGLAHTGARDQITEVEVAGVRVAVLGFSPYAWTNSVIDLEQARAVVTRAAKQADLVLVQAHMGAEGADQTRVRPGGETYFGEDRGDPIAFARAVIDAGADLVIGHGPHVMRGLEFYQGRLIAYSLGNFAAGGGTLRAEGNLGLGAVLKVSLHPDGSWAGGEFISTHMRDRGRPRLDPTQDGLNLVRGVTEQDFPQTGARLAADGTISPPQG